MRGTKWAEIPLAPSIKHSSENQHMLIKVSSTQLWELNPFCTSLRPTTHRNSSFNPPTPPCLTQFTCRLSPGCVICVQTQSRSFPLPSLLSLTFTPEDFSEGSLCLTEQAELSERLLFSSPDKVTISWVKIHLQGRSAFSYKWWSEFSLGFIQAQRMTVCFLNRSMLLLPCNSNTGRKIRS